MHKDYNTPSKILDEYSELAQNKAMKTRASRVNAIFEFYSTRSIIFFRDKISVEQVESSKMSTLVHMSMYIISACLTTCFSRQFLCSSQIKVFSILLKNCWQAWNTFGLIKEYRNAFQDPMNTNSTIRPNSKEILRI